VGVKDKINFEEREVATADMGEEIMKAAFANAEAAESSTA
jgi:hypothetical protein